MKKEAGGNEAEETEYLVFRDPPNFGSLLVGEMKVREEPSGRVNWI